MIKSAPSITCSDIMKEPMLVTKGTCVKDLHAMISVEGSAHILVVESDQLVGIISKEDILRKVLQIATNSSGKVYTELQLHAVTASEIMTSPVIHAKTSDSISLISDLFVAHRINGLPIVSPLGTPVGIITPIDVLQLQKT